MSNRLAEASSPYLLQHQNNPVDWYPWGDAAFELARREGKPIFLSIGYSACHWCHVMERESFENAEIAKILNDHFVSIKVDREQRPDLDHIYMQAVQTLTGRGGWPMSVFLTEGGQPFFGGTYWPPEPRHGMPGFDQVLLSVAEAWRDRRSQVAEQASRLTESLQAVDHPSVGELLQPDELFREAGAALEAAFDSTNGGFGGAPKFPHPLEINLCFRLARRFGEKRFEEMATLSLNKMADGGIYDHLGGGFHRYSVDAFWQVPHFEKMLYDNALLAGCYLEAYLATGHARYRRTLCETLDYVLREMQHPDGGFYSTQDADSEGEEGKFFVWSEEEIIESLGSDLGHLFCRFYGVTAGGNFEGKNILHVSETVEEFAQSIDGDARKIAGDLQDARQRLLEIREQRIHPGLDDKVLTDWNGLMIDPLARAGVVLGIPEYLDAARRAGRMIHEQMSDSHGRLVRCSRRGVMEGEGFLDDYAALLGAWITLYECTFEETWIDRAVRLAEQLQSRFEDSEQGGFFFTARDQENLIVRRKEFFDQATPNGNALAAEGFLRLGNLLGNDAMRRTAARALEAAADTLRRAPLAQGQTLLALLRHHAPPRQWVMAAGTPGEEMSQVVQSLRQTYLPDHVLACRVDPKQDATSRFLDPLFTGRPSAGHAWELFYCENFTCRQPARSVAEANALVAASASS